MSQPLHLGISTCPNDTFCFYGILADRVDRRGLDFRVELVDVEELNRRLFAGEFDVAKASFHAALMLAAELGVLPVGSALGFGVGPLLLAARAGTRPDDWPGRPADPPIAVRTEAAIASAPGTLSATATLSAPATDSTTATVSPPATDSSPAAASATSRPARVLCPGAHTTATLLYRLFYPGAGQVEQVVFSEIMPALEAGRADFGVCIHEGRFTYAERNLALVEDLGTRWEQQTSAPLPLGGIVARHGLGRETHARLAAVIADSLDYALAHREETLPLLRRYAQELDDAVIWSHVDLYVNQWTRQLGSVGRHALDRLNAEARRAGVLPAGLPPLTIVGE